MATGGGFSVLLQKKFPLPTQQEALYPMKSFVKRCILLMAALCLLMGAVSLPRHSQAAGLIRIGYVDLNGFLYTDTDGRQSGYIYDLMMECAQLTDRPYIFVRINADKCYEMLKSGRVDLCVGVPATIPNRENLTFSDHAVATTSLSLVVNLDSTLGYEDYSHLTDGTIGAYAPGFSTSYLDMLLKGLGVQAALDDTYQNRQQLLDDLSSGKIVAAILDTDMGITDLRVIGQFAKRDLYCVALKNGDQSILNEMDKTLYQLTSSRPTMLNDLHQKYILVNDDVYPSLTRDELNFIRWSGTVKVAIPRSEMLSNEEAVPQLQRVLDELSQKTGITFEYMPRDTESEALKLLTSGKAEILLGFDSDYGWAHKQGVMITSPYLQSTYRVMKKPGITVNRTIAVVEDSYIEYRLGQEDKYQLLPCKTVKDCIVAVQEGKTDAAICWTPDAEQVLYELGEHGLLYDDVEEFGGSVSIAIGKQTSFRLVPLLDKAIACVRPQRFQTIALSPVGELYYAQRDVENQRLNVTFAIIAICLFALLVGLSLLVSRRLHTYHAQVQARNDYLRTINGQIRRTSQTLQGITASGARLNRADTAAALSVAGDDLSELSAEMDVLSQLDDRTFMLALEPVRPLEAFNRMADIVRRRVAAHGVRLDVRLPKKEYPIVMLDEERYRRACLILVDDMLRRTDAGGQIELSFLLEQDSNNQWTLVTSMGDDGVMLSRQFVRFFSEKITQNSEQVLGLGLMTVKRLVQAMGGELGVRQRPNAGMRLHISLPVEAAEPLQIMSMNYGVYSDKGLLAGTNVLLAEENSITAQMLYSLLINEGAHVDLADSGNQLVDRFLDSAPAFYQVILTSLQLPGMTGEEAARSIRDLPRRDCGSVLIIGMQAGNAPVDPNTTKAMNVILQKPVDTASLCRRIEQWLKE